MDGAFANIVHYENHYSKLKDFPYIAEAIGPDKPAGKELGDLLKELQAIHSSSREEPSQETPSQDTQSWGDKVKNEPPPFPTFPQRKRRR